MTSIRGTPPGRAGRVWLHHRLEVAERGAGLLENKLRILAAEEQRFALLVARNEREWTEAVAEADLWLSRARVISGQRGLRLAAAPSPAAVEVQWETTMGVHYPSRALTQIPEPPLDAATPDNSALVLARQAYQRAIVVGADYATAARALSAVRHEVNATRRRLRALEKRWTPRLVDATNRLADDLEEQEREDGIRMRWGANRMASGQSGTSQSHDPRSPP